VSVAPPPHRAATSPAMSPAPPRVSASGVLDEQPLRRPNTRSPKVMTRRAWWLVVLNFLVPGSAQVLAGNRRLGRVGLVATIVMWVVALLAVLTGLMWRSLLVTLATNPFLLLLAQAVLLAYAVLWIVLTIDTLRLARLVKTRPRARFGIALLAIVGMVISSGGAAWASIGIIGPLRGGLSIFAAGPPVEPSDGYYNILLLGADSGQGRDSMRFDSISVVSVDADTGRVTITGIPRDLEGAPFSAGPMQDLYPDGFEGHRDQTCGWSAGINQLTNAVEVCREDRGVSLYPDAEKASSTPAVEATKDAAEGILGIEIPYYVFIDMKGFADLVDALGGVDITVEQRLPKGGGPSYEGEPVESWATGWIEAGEQHMDGDTAQWYARSRKTTSDWDRMKRQRQLQQAILDQITPTTVLTNFSALMDAGTDLVNTDIPTSLLPYLADLAVDAQQQKVTTIELTPDNGVDQENADWEFVREMVRDALHPASETSAPTE